MLAPLRVARNAHLVVFCLLAACAGMPGPWQADDASDTKKHLQGAANALESADPVLSFLNSEASTSTGVILDTATGADVRVTAGHVYDAASGRKCRRYQIKPLGSGSISRSGLACQAETGKWEKVRPLLNLDSWRLLTEPARIEGNTPL